MASHGVATFKTTTEAIKAEMVVTRAGLYVKLMQTPSQAKGAASVSLRFGWQYKKDVQETLAQANVDYIEILKL